MPDAPPSFADRYADSADRFAADTADHTMTVLHDDGLYRHLRFKRPGTGFYWFDLVTWPGRLSFSGDMDGYVFARETDMFEFFRAHRSAGFSINPDYWAEKVDGSRGRTKTYSEDLFRRLVKEHFEDAVRGGDTPHGLGRAMHEEIFDDLEGELAYEESARDVLNRFEYKGFRFTDTWEWDFSDYNWSFLWCCHAIRWGIAQYDAASAVPAVVDAVVSGGVL